MYSMIRLNEISYYELLMEKFNLREHENMFNIYYQTNLMIVAVNGHLMIHLGNLFPHFALITLY